MSRVNLSESATTTYTTDTQQRIFCSHGPPGTCVVNSYDSNAMGVLVTISDLIDAPCLASAPTLRHLFVCGDGFLAPGEECDDGNTQFGDGCWNCNIQCGWICTPGMNSSNACNIECGDTFDSCTLNCTKSVTLYYDTCYTTILRHMLHRIPPFRRDTVLRHKNVTLYYHRYLKSKKIRANRASSKATKLFLRK